jgi:Kef-type K+ transport system membrane component KefB
MEFHTFLLQLALIYLAARVMGEIAVRLGQSAVLGELLAGVLVGGSVLDWIEPTEVLSLLGQVGVMLLLFEVGLESDLESFLKVGWSATLVAIIGVLTPFALGYGGALLLHLSPLQAIFLGATLTATSVAITARVFQEMGRLDSPEGQIILGAAVLDDILGLVILSVVVALAESGSVSWLKVGATAGAALFFLVAAILVGFRYAHLFTRIVDNMKTRGRVIVAATTFALLAGYAAESVGVAAIVGAFAAGLILERTENQAHIHELLRPVADVFVPIFFVMVGVAVDLSKLNPFNGANWPVLGLAGALAAAAIVGKLVSGWGARGPGVNRLAIGVGMLPRGEVGLIFAGVGLSHGVIATGEYSALLLVIVLTTFLAPILLKRVFRPQAM